MSRISSILVSYASSPTPAYGVQQGADIKPNNIMIEWKEDGGEIVIEQVQLTDIEDSAYVGSRQAIVGKQMGNYMWRSPEAHAQGKLHKYSDMFSFGIVVSSPRIFFSITTQSFSITACAYVYSPNLSLSRIVHLRPYKTRHLRRCRGRTGGRECGTPLHRSRASNLLSCRSRRPRWVLGASWRWPLGQCIPRYSRWLRCGESA